MYPLKLAANFAAWKIFTARKSHPDFLAFSRSVFERDENICQFCGFELSEFQEVINPDKNYGRPTLENSLTACYFCAQCFFLESVGQGDFGGGTLIYLPEISQSDLNAFCHVMFNAMAKETEEKSAAESLYRDLRFRSQPMEEAFGEGTSDPAIFGRMLMELNAENQASVQGALEKSIRLLPLRSRFKAQIA
ncbi:MAG: type IVB secretion system protein IcmJDotN [Gammaproteobacteria bacterium]